MAAKAGDVVGSAVVSGLSKVTETVGLGRLVSESEANDAGGAGADAHSANACRRQRAARSA